MSEDLIHRRTEAEAVAEIARAEYRGEIVTVSTPDGVTARAALLPAGRGAVNLKFLEPKEFDDWRDRPRFRQGTAELTDIRSFIKHANRFKDGDSALFACDDADAPSITAVLDYHCARNVDPAEIAEADSAPRFGHHRGEYRFPFSEEWKAWRDIDGKTLEPVQFAEFLEDRILDVLPPPDFLTTDAAAKGAKLDPADQKLRDIAKSIGGRVCGPSTLMELSKGIQVHSLDQTHHMLDLSSGEVRLKFETKNRDSSGKPLTLPNLFLVAVPIFRNGASYRIPVRLRYRAAGGSVAWTLLMHRPDLYLDDALREAFDKAQEETGLPLYRGKPE